MQTGESSHSSVSLSGLKTSEYQGPGASRGFCCVDGPAACLIDLRVLLQAHSYSFNRWL